MNERIKELMTQASTIRYSGFGDTEILDPEKFAELIVQECCNTILEFDYNYASSPNKAMEFAVEDLKDRFGVK